GADGRVSEEASGLGPGGRVADPGVGGQVRPGPVRVSEVGVDERLLLRGERVTAGQNQLPTPSAWFSDSGRFGFFIGHHRSPPEVWLVRLRKSTTACRPAADLVSREGMRLWI